MAGADRLSDKRARQQRIRKILAHNEIHSQEELRDLLAAESIRITQATLSRDLRDIGAVRGERGYIVQANRAAETLDRRAIERSVKGVVEIQRGGTMIVLRTEPGHAPLVAREIDRVQIPQVIGIIAGQETVFIATGSAGAAGELLKILRRAAYGR